jgi:hypothetical protein
MTIKKKPVVVKKAAADGNANNPKAGWIEEIRVEPKGEAADPRAEPSKPSIRPRQMATMDVDPRWIEEILGQPKGDARSDPSTNEKASTRPGRRAQMTTMDVDPSWIEEARGGKKAAPPPLPASELAKPKRKVPPPIPREDDDPPAKPATRSVRPEAKTAARRSVRPPKR